MTTRPLIANRNLRAFLAGIGSILDLSGTAFLPERKTDAENLRGDWEKVLAMPGSNDEEAPTGDRSRFADPTEALAWAVKTFREIQEHRRRNFGFEAGWWR